MAPKIADGAFLSNPRSWSSAELARVRLAPAGTIVLTALLLARIKGVFAALLWSLDLRSGGPSWVWRQPAPGEISSGGVNALRRSEIGGATGSGSADIQPSRA